MVNKGSRKKPVLSAVGRRAASSAAAKEKESQAAAERLEANRKAVEDHLLQKLAKDLGGGVDLKGWVVQFDLERLTGHPRGERTGQALSTRDKSIRYLAPTGKVLKTREAVAQHLGLVKEEDEEVEEERSSAAAKSAKPIKEPPPVEIGDELAFEVERLLDVRRDERGRREFKVRWVGYSSADDSWEPEHGLLDRDPIDAFEAKRPNLLPHTDSIWRREQRVGPEHQVAELPAWRPPPKPPKRPSASQSSAPEHGGQRGGVRGRQLASMLEDAAKETAALMTAVAYGPVSPLCFVAPAEGCDLGLFARVDLPKGTPITEYAGPVLPRHDQRQSGYNLGIPGGSGGVGSAEAPFFIDGDSSQVSS